MASETPPEGFDSFIRGEDPTDSVLDALAIYSPGEPVETETTDPVFTVTNPPGTVAVSTFLDGRVSQIELSPKAAELTEADLAAEVVVIAGLATREAKSAQHAMMLEGMREQGHDDAATRDFLTRDLDLPSPEQARAERARVFATRYAGDDD
ncbi:MULTISPECIES: secretion protein EspD [unclassified Mycobacterium]|uniref:secretion protein EspD n=1 Tax=unclassified Mycobacterium TaxID=2642494 RepID=UPI0009E88DE8|nr:MULTISPECIES: secretion protein EspD [unclassified Mycobacterium]